MRELAGVVLYELTGVLSVPVCSTVVLSGGHSGGHPGFRDLDGRSTVGIFLGASKSGTFPDERPRLFERVALVSFFA